MGKKGSWFSAIKKVFTPSSKDKVTDGTKQKSSKEKKKKGFIPLFREPSSIEKILGEVEREHHLRNPRPQTPTQGSNKLPPHVTPLVRNTTLLWDDGDSSKVGSPPRAPSPPRVASPPRIIAHSSTSLQETVRPTSPGVPTPPPRRVASFRRPVSEVTPATRIIAHSSTSLQETTRPTSPGVPTPPPRRAASFRRQVSEVTPARVPSPRPVQKWRPEPTLKNQHVCATKIQTAFRGYMARRNYRALKGLVRLQGVVKGQSVKRQTANTMKCMQMLVRVQTQIQARRIQLLENQTPQCQAVSKNENDLESNFGKWMAENQEDWDDSTLTKEEVEARMRRKFDAIVKRERTMAYAYSRQSLKSSPRINHGALADFRTGGYPYWWNWFDQRKPLTTSVSKSPSMSSFHLTPSRPTINFKASPLPQSSNTGRFLPGFSNMDTPSPRSTRSSVPARTRQALTPPGRLPQRFFRSSAANSPNATFRDDDSLTSCPPFTGPRFMSPTASAQAKLKQPGKSLFPDSPGFVTSEVSKRRVSYPLSKSPGGGSFRWNKGSLFPNKDTSSHKSIDSSTSMPASVGRKPFNRFV